VALEDRESVPQRQVLKHESIATLKRGSNDPPHHKDDVKHGAASPPKSNGASTISARDEVFITPRLRGSRQRERASAEMVPFSRSR